MESTAPRSQVLGAPMNHQVTGKYAGKGERVAENLQNADLQNVEMKLLGYCCESVFAVAIMVMSFIIYQSTDPADRDNTTMYLVLGNGIGHAIFLVRNILMVSLVFCYQIETRSMQIFSFAIGAGNGIALTVISVWLLVDAWSPCTDPQLQDIACTSTTVLVWLAISSLATRVFLVLFFSMTLCAFSAAQNRILRESEKLQRHIDAERAWGGRNGMVVVR